MKPFVKPHVPRPLSNDGDVRATRPPLALGVTATSEVVSSDKRASVDLRYTSSRTVPVAWVVASVVDTWVHSSPTVKSLVVTSLPPPRPQMASVPLNGLPRDPDFTQMVPSYPLPAGELTVTSCESERYGVPAYID